MGARAAAAGEVVGECGEVKGEGGGAGTCEAGKTRAPELAGGVGWVNTDRPVTVAELRGKSVILEFWTCC